MIFISTASIKNHSIENVLDTLVEAGISNIELSGGTKHCDDLLSKLKVYKEKHNLNFLVHNYFPPPEDDFVLNIASSDETLRKKNVDFVKQSIEFAHGLEVGSYTLHAGYRKVFVPVKDRDYFVPEDSPDIDAGAAAEIMYRSVLEIKETADRCGVRFGIENLFPIDSSPDSSLLCTPQDIFRFLDDFADCEQIGLLLDLGHLYISSNHFGFDKDDFIKDLLYKYECKIFGIHLSGNDGKRDTHSMLFPDSWQIKAVKRFAEGNMPVTMESRGLTVDMVLSQLQMVEDIIGRDT